MTLDVVQLPLGPIETNCYLVRRAGSAEAVVVDPAADATTIRLKLASRGARCVAILITHGHWDHLGGVADLAEGSGAPVHMSREEISLLENLSERAPSEVVYRNYIPDVLLNGDELLDLAGVAFQTISVPGHSPDHLGYAANGSIFCGDVLFAGGVGRTDLPGSDWETLRASIRTLVEGYLPETVVYPGHGPPTTLGQELASNPFLADLRTTLQ